jgi:magnesium chelatase family protein
LLDRIDLHLEVPAVKFQDITSQRNGEPSATIRERVIAAQFVHPYVRLSKFEI